MNDHKSITDRLSLTTAQQEVDRLTAALAAAEGRAENRTVHGREVFLHPAPGGVWYITSSINPFAPDWLCKDGTWRTHFDNGEGKYLSREAALDCIREFSEDPFFRQLAAEKSAREAAEKELDELRAKLAEVKAGYEALDKNWNTVHEAAMGAIRKALGNPDATVPEICAKLDNAAEVVRGPCELLEGNWAFFRKSDDCYCGQSRKGDLHSDYYAIRLPERSVKPRTNNQDPNQ